MSVGQAIPFTMNYFALKTFGKQQYSNVWAALSELIANGFDAGANNVYLFLDMSEKKRAIVEIIDDGSGMDEDDLREKYAVIGRNRRLDDVNDTAAGRKGIGKLAALYLSDKYQIISCKAGLTTAWGVDVQGKRDNEIPSLEPIDFSEMEFSCAEIWNLVSENSGTMIRLVDVDLTRIGDRAIESLKRRLSNQFILGAVNRNLYLSIVKRAGDEVMFEEVHKEIAFDNMAFILTSDPQLIDARTDKALSAKNIKTGRIVQPDTIRYVDEEMYRKWMKEEVQRGDILITSEAPFGQILFWDSDEKIVLSQRLFCVRIKPEYDARFIYYYMTTPEFQGELDGRATGTTVVGLRQSELMKCIIHCPEIQEQKAISAILSSVDAKILANEKINDNLAA